MLTYDDTPSSIIAGDNIVWTVNNQGYSISQFKFGYGFISQDGKGQQTVNQNGTSNGFPQFNLSSSDSDKWEPGTYYFQLYAFDTTNSNARTTIGRGEMIVTPDYTKQPEVTQTMRTYQAICDLLENRANDDIQSTSINGKSIVSMASSQLMEMRSYYDGLVKSEENLRRTQSGKKSRRNIRVRFNPVGGRGWWGGQGRSGGM